MRLGTVISGAAALGTLFVLFVPHWHRPVDGHDVAAHLGSGSAQFDPAEPEVIRINRPPPPLPAGRWGVEDSALADTRPAGEVYRNLQVVQDGSAGDFMKLHVAMTGWVSPQQGCAFCHQGTDWPSDANPRKGAAREMLRMTRTVNTDPHTAPSGVTCYTCHRGQNVPPLAWYPSKDPVPPPFIARQEPWHETASTVRDFFPDAAFAEYLVQATPARGSPYTALPTSGPPAFIEVIRLYEVMMQMSDGIGVNCGYCHESRAFFDWSQSTPARWTGLSGLDLTRRINNEVLLPLAPHIPQTVQIAANPRPPTVTLHEAGPQNGNALATCATCHYGMPKPLNGADLVSGFPWLKGASR